MSVETTCHNAIKLIFSHQDCSAFQGKFYTWQESISHFIKAEAEKSYQQIKTKASVTFVHSFLAGVYVVAVLSLHQTEIFLQDIEENSKFNKDQAIYCNFVIETCCFLLNLNNQKYLKTLSSNCKDHWLNAKRNIFKNFLKKKLKSHPKSTDEIAAISKWTDQIGSKSLRNLYEKVFKLKDAHISSSRSTVNDENIVPDGRIIKKLCDPPGQKSVYIPPGDTSQESYRLSTFLRFPQTAAVNPSELAFVGFFFTGYKDRVKCFVCGLSVEGWMVGDDPRDFRWHQPNCALVKGEESGNKRIGADSWCRRFGSASTEMVRTQNYTRQDAFPSFKLPTQSNGAPVNGINTSYGGYNEYLSARKQSTENISSSTNSDISYKAPAFATISSPHHEHLLKNLDLRREDDRLKSFNGWISTFVTPKDLALCGFFYLGNSDRCQCFSCEGVLRNWSYGDNVASEHKKHFPQCRMAFGLEVNNVPLSVNGTYEPRLQSKKEMLPKPKKSAQVLLYQNFPCLFPVNPHMKEESARLLTFDQRWPASKIHATPLQIVKAGFYFLGERDRVKCWYCNGGLQNWEPMDEPWREHAKWFPTCEFLLQQKGPDFVHMVVDLFPNLRRPVLRNGFDVPPSVRSANLPAPVSVIDPQVEMKRTKERIEKELASDIAKMALDMGFSPKSIKRAVKKQLTSNNEMFRNLSGLVDAMVDSTSDSDEEMSESNVSVETHGISKQSEKAVSKVTESSISLEERVKQLQDQRQCKICLDAVAEVVFVPCGHLCCCVSCAQSMRKCPICRVKIEKAIKTYLS